MSRNRHTKFMRRQHMLQPDYEIYYFSDVNLHPVAEHAHDFYELYFFLEGNMELSLGATRYTIHPNEFYIVPPGLAHFPEMIAPDKPYRRFVLWLSKEYYETLQQQAEEYGYIQKELIQTKTYVFSCETIIFNEIQALIFKLIDEDRNERFGKSVQSRLILSELLLYLNRIIYEHHKLQKISQDENIYYKVSNYVNQHLQEDLSLNSIANGLYLNKFYLSHAFKKESGLSLHQFILKRRLHLCKNALLNPGTSCKICFEYGFQDYSSFYRAFKKEYGISPKNYLQELSALRKPE